MPDTSAIAKLPEISFIDGRSIEDIRSEMVADYEAYMAKETGAAYTLNRAAPHRMEIYAAAAQIYQAMQYIDRAGKSNLIKYSYGDYLDNVAAFRGLRRESASAATTTIRFTLSVARETATAIPQGTRVGNGNQVYFATDAYAEIPAGETTLDVPATSTMPGADANGIAPGALDTLADPVPYMESAVNLTKTEGGAEIESDESLAERVYLAPGAYSVAGPEAAYIYFAKMYNQTVGDVVVTSDTTAGHVEVRFILNDGATPGEEMIDGMADYLRSNGIRPETDTVTVSAPEEVQYRINMTYWINCSDSAQAVKVQESVQNAVRDYTAWQRKIGRDINPDALRRLVMNAGAKRTEIRAPTYAVVPGICVAALDGEAAVQYGGLEDD